MTNSINYNNADNVERTIQLRNAKVEESQIPVHVKARFETLPQDVQNKLNASA
jgi:hypothetical protein